MAALAREHDVLLYMDDAHGFGVIGERSESGTVLAEVAERFQLRVPDAG